MGKRKNSSKQNNTSNEDIDQLLIELGWSNRSLISSYLALYGTILVVILRRSRHIVQLDKINGTNFAESVVSNGMSANDIIETFPRIVDELFLVLAINSVESSFETLVNKYNLRDVNESDISEARDALVASYFAYLAAKISYDIDVGTLDF